ncbi:MAG: hypothetical protein AAF570_26125, partial [Bacteroidota bacterium]
MAKPNTITEQKKKKQVKSGATARQKKGSKSKLKRANTVHPRTSSKRKTGSASTKSKRLNRKKDDKTKNADIDSPADLGIASPLDKSQSTVSSAKKKRNKKRNAKDKPKVRKTKSVLNVDAKGSDKGPSANKPS